MRRRFDSFRWYHASKLEHDGPPKASVASSILAGASHDAEWSSLVARRAHNPKVARFESRLRNLGFKRRKMQYDSTMAYKNPEDRKAAAKRHYEANKDAYKRRAKEWTAQQRPRLRALVIKSKAVPCLDCGERYPTPVMEFDHVRGDKLYDIANAVTHGVSIETLQAEINKCEVVCANCHRLRTMSRGEPVPEV